MFTSNVETTMKWIILTLFGVVFITYTIDIVEMTDNNLDEDTRLRRDNTVYGSYYYKDVSIVTRWCENYELQFHFILKCNTTYMPKCCQIDSSNLYKNVPFCVGTELGYRYSFIYNFYNICAYFYYMCILYDPDDFVSSNYPCLFPIDAIKRSDTDCDGGKNSTPSNWLNFNITLNGNNDQISFSLTLRFVMPRVQRRTFQL